VVPGLNFSAIPVSISVVSLGRLSLSTYILFRFKGAKWAVSSSNSFQCLFVYFNTHDSNIATAELIVISTETTCWEIERK
jgi:hypothetical protein